MKILRMPGPAMPLPTPVPALEAAVPFLRLADRQSLDDLNSPVPHCRQMIQIKCRRMRTR